jgi:hypothetical protein
MTFRVIYLIILNQAESFFNCIFYCLLDAKGEWFLYFPFITISGISLISKKNKNFPEYSLTEKLKHCGSCQHKQYRMAVLCAWMPMSGLPTLASPPGPQSVGSNCLAGSKQAGYGGILGYVDVAAMGVQTAALRVCSF